MAETPGTRHEGLIVVGADGSDHARRALRFGMEEARLRGLPVRAVCAYEYTPDRYAAYGWLTAPDPDGALYRQVYDNALHDVTETVREVLAELGNPDVRVEPVAEPGRPAKVLLEASRDATMLVVGSRGSGMWGRLTLGSTSTEVVHNAHLPVVVLPPRDPEGDADGSEHERTALTGGRGTA
ncbi:universal stress protein [Streptomyces oceani]|uniref:universal stress protein n=1 Tax=Streptomyces oceani TaxID=1075402 RepID=UPI000871CD80|nr:universal stress protein [Streptomyces oceani]